ncbi:MAG: biotin attachment protein [Burkholderiales bacterium]|nr:biotin attachment protein [Opitutaceae bacterium]
MKKLRVTVEGKVYEVLVEILDDAGSPMPSAPAQFSAAPAARAQMAASITAPPISAPASTSAAAAGPATEGDIPSPLAGKVVSIDVKPGQAVAEGAQVATVEAMKMNTYIYAPRTGTIAAILVNPGDGVEEGSVLLRLA